VETQLTWSSVTFCLQGNGANNIPTVSFRIFTRFVTFTFHKTLRLTCGEIFFVTRLLLSLLVKEL